MKLFFLILFNAVVIGFASRSTIAASLSLQELRNSEVTNLPAATLSQLGDPLFRLALKDHAEETRLSRLVELLGGEAGAKPRLFIVDEDLANSAQPARRRAVLAFDGRGPGGETLNGNVMFSFLISSKGWSNQPGNLEAWGWDEQRARYNYYRSDGSPEQWRFRGSSVNADRRSPAERRGTCLQCHVSGGPVMKELLFPWNNWHSFKTINEISAYLIADNSKAWPVTAHPEFRNKLDSAERLETKIIGSLHNFNTKRLSASLERDPGTGEEITTEMGGQRQGTVVAGRRLLRPLFETGEVNLISSDQASGRHPLETGTTFSPDVKVPIPGNLFMNASLIAGGSLAISKGLGLSEANQLADLIKLSRKEYHDLVDQSKVKWKGQQGDTHFAWFMPEPSVVENDILDQALRKGIITPHFLAATVAVNLERPVFSDRRKNLLRFVPDRFPYLLLADGADPAPGRLSGDELTNRVIGALEAINPAGGSAEAEWLDGLRSPDAVARLRDRIKQFIAKARQDFDPGDPARRQAALQGLFARAITARKAMLQHPVLGSLDETGNGRLLPVP